MSLMLHPQKLMMSYERSKSSVSMDGIIAYYSYIGIFRSPIFHDFSRIHLEFPAFSDTKIPLFSWRNRSPRRCCIASRTLNTVRQPVAGWGRGTEWHFFLGFVSTWEMIINHETCRKMGIGVENLIQHDYHEIIIYIYYHCLSWLFINSVSHPPSYNLPSESLEAKQCSWASP